MIEFGGLHLVLIMKFIVRENGILSRNVFILVNFNKSCTVKMSYGSIYAIGESCFPLCQGLVNVFQDK